jgi:hypothetical protein
MEFSTGKCESQLFAVPLIHTIHTIHTIMNSVHRLKEVYQLRPASALYPLIVLLPYTLVLLFARSALLVALGNTRDHNKAHVQIHSGL